MSDYPWWVIRVDESPLSSTCFTILIYSQAFFILAFLCVAAWFTAGRQLPRYMSPGEAAGIAVAAGAAWPIALLVIACRCAWKALVALMLAIQARREQ